MRILIFVYILLSFPLNLFADTLTVKLDGTGDYSSIQTAIGWSTSGDVILVYPGTYLENIDCYGRDDLTIASLFLLNPVDSIIQNTIINGNQTGTCIAASRGENNLKIIGLTVTNGSGTEFSGFSHAVGGGIFIKDASISIFNCNIIRNYSSSGGGILTLDSEVRLSKTNICNNYSYGNGGGINNGNSELIFDTINLCNIYLNSAEKGYDYFQYSGTSPPCPFSIDTATIMNPDHYYFLCTNTDGFPDCDLYVKNIHCKIQAVQADLFVSPLGNDNNSGETESEPLATITFALLKIVADSLQSHSIHLANGTYSISNGTNFPLGLKGNVPIIGDDKLNTIIDLEFKTTFAFGNSNEEKIVLKNLNIKNGMCDSLNSTPSILHIRYCKSVDIESLIMEYCDSKETCETFTTYRCDSVILRNSVFKENHATNCVAIYGKYLSFPPYSELNGCSIKNNYPNSNQLFDLYGKGLTISNGNIDSDYMISRIINCEIINNTDSSLDPVYPATSGIGISYNTVAYIINSTIGNNNSTNSNSAAIGIARNSDVYVYNSIINGNNAYQILLYNTISEESCSLSVYNSQVENGEAGIVNLSPYSTYYYDLTNLEENPQWIGTGEFPYTLLNDSPCINTGTQNLPEGIILPDTDLMGGPRISGGQVDMGAYEFLFVGVNENSQANNEYFKVSPNPFKDELSIYFEKSVYGKNVVLDLYDLKGNLVQSIFLGKVKDESVIWFSEKDNPNIHPGVYFLRITIEDSKANTLKVIKL
jgi:hypothetical protein